MCNLYSITTSPQAVLRLFRVSHNRAAAFEPLPAVFPGHTVPIVRRAPDGERELVAMSWGFVLLQQGKAPKRVTNARDDKLDGPFWRSSMAERRCLVPASSFCEPHDGRTPATWHWFALAGEDPRPTFAFAGLWRRWRGPLKKDGPAVACDVFAFATTLPNALTATINHERSPVLLRTDAERDTWLTGSVDEARALVRPTEAEGMRIVQAGLEKKDWLGVEPPPSKAMQARLL